MRWTNRSRPRRFTASRSLPTSGASRRSSACGSVTATSNVMRRVVPTWRAAALALWAGAALSCGGGGGDDPPDTGGPPPPPQPDPQFSNITTSTGIEFVHGIVNPTDSKAEMFGGGVAAGDYDGDGDLDLYVVRGDIGPNLLYRNDGNNQFTDVAAAAGRDHAAPGGGGYLHRRPAFAEVDGDGDRG